MKQLKIEVSITDRGAISLDKYLTDVSRERMVTQEQEVELAQRIKRGDQEALEILVKANLRFVISVAKQYQGHGMTLGDMIGEGNLGLIKAAERFDETRGFKFISYAVWWIRQSIIAAISQQSRTIRLPVNQMSDMYKIKRATAELEQRLERAPTVEELADHTTFTEFAVEASLRNSKRVQSIDMPYNDTDELSLGDFLTDETSPTTDALALEESLSKEIHSALNHLSDMERDVLCMFFGIGQPERTLSEIAVRVNLTKERVRQIKTRALKNLMKMLGRDHSIFYNN